MKRVVVVVVSIIVLAGLAYSQTQSPQSQSSKKQTNSSNGDNPDDILNSPMTPPRSDSPKKSTDEEFPFPESEEPGSYSSSKDHGDISPPTDDATHPGADVPVIPAPGVPDVTEMKPWNPHTADKDVEVGIFYFKRYNYRAAEARFRDALYWQDNHAEATYRLALVLEKEGKISEAQQYYQSYLKILPSGEFAGDSKKALARLNATNEGQKKSAKKPATSPPS